ncbi:MAG TPA: hypothetical protein PKX15_08845 [Bacteroidales bacterium]|nr:hypothetical protein [Bacteroidales bacterium]
MGILLNDFFLNRYGLNVRFVDENDAKFILELRVNPKLNKYIHYTEDDINKQIVWIKDYKLREKKGLEYYFIFLENKSPIGVFRIYNIKKTYATIGSWICKPDLIPEKSIATYIIGNEIFFDYLNLKESRFDVRKDNKHVVKLHKLFGAQIINENELDYFLKLSDSDFNNNKRKIINLLSLS